MDHRTRKLIQDTWTVVSVDPKKAADIFYSKLFELDPSIQFLFRGDLDEQKKRLMGMFNVAVRGLDRLDEMLPVLAELGSRHKNYQVRPEHYSTMGEALVFMVGTILRSDSNEEIESAWREAYSRWSEAMIEGSRGP